MQERPRRLLTADALDDERDEIGKDERDLEPFRRQERVPGRDEFDHDPERPVECGREERRREDEDRNLTYVGVAVLRLKVRHQPEDPTDHFACTKETSSVTASSPLQSE